MGGPPQSLQQRKARVLVITMAIVIMEEMIWQVQQVMNYG
jgi:hypothetical protein